MAKTRKLISYDRLEPEKGIDYSKDHLRRLARADPPRFPKTVKPPGGAPNCRMCWFEDDIDAWLANLGKTRSDSGEGARH